MSLDPSTIGRYRVIGTLGSGAMGTVYLAEDPVLKRPLAIKVVREGTGDAEILERFKREAEISARLNHPNAITVFDVGDEPGVGPFLVMEYIEGESLADVIKRGPLDPAQAAGLLVQAGAALEAVHALGILHRDIKPENFMVARDGRIKLMDFGIARGDEGRLTATASFLGSPAYAAPEVLNGASATAAADRWSFALAAFELLTGRLPFPGESVGSVLYRIIHDDPVFPEGMAPELVDVFRRALDKEPARRYPDLRSFLRDLLGALPLDPSVRSGFLSHLNSAAAVKPTSTLRLDLPAAVPPPSGRRRLYLLVGLLVAVLLGAATFLRHESSRVLSLDSQPSGAEVFLDGTPLGRTPLRQVVVKGKAEIVRFEKLDFLTEEVHLRPEDEVIGVNLELAPFRVPVASEPAGAEVFLDDVAKGHTPMFVEVPGEGPHQLRLVLDGYRAWSIVPERRKPLPNPVPLERAVIEKAPAPAEKAPPPVRKPSVKKAPVKKPPPPEPEEDSKVKKFFRDLFKKEPPPRP